MTTKIAISVPDDVLADARVAVERGQAASVSAWFAQAAQQQGRRSRLSDLVAELIAEHGQPTAADYAWADAALGLQR